MKSSNKQTAQKYDHKRWLVPMNERVSTNENRDTEYEYDAIIVEAENAEDAEIKAQKQVLEAELEECKEAFFNELLEANMSLGSAKKYKVIKVKYDSIGKVVQTTEGDGSMQNPFKTWKEGMKVEKGDWWMTHDGYLWEAIKSGVPGSSTDRDYWDVVGI